jgi:excinuclease ABC subunit C
MPNGPPAISLDEHPVIYFAPRPDFESFGDWTLFPQLTWPRASVPINGESKECRKLIRGNVPNTPGIYGMVDSDGELIYIGKSKSLRNRLASYFAESAPSKAQSIIAHTERLLWERAPDEFAALLRELELIRRWRPRFNVRGQPNQRRPAYLVIGRGPVGHVYLASEPAKGDTLVFGPLRASQGCREAVHVLNNYFQLCICNKQTKTRFTDQREMFPSENAARCVRRDLGNCLAPCASGCSSAQYTDRLQEAKRFLRGTDLSALRHLEEAMTAAASAHRYEEAAVYRDTHETLENIHQQLNRFQKAQRHYNFIYPLQGNRQQSIWYVINRGQVHAAIFEPRTRKTAKQCLAIIEQIYARRTPSITETLREDVEMTFLVALWFRTRPKELKNTFSPDAAKDKLQAMMAK